MSILERRLIREASFGLTGKLWQISWLYVLLLCALAGVGYVALYSAAGGAPEPFASKHILRFGFGVVLMVCIAMVDIRVIARFSWLGYLAGVILLILVLKMGHTGKGAERWINLGGMQRQLFLIPPALAVLVPVVLILKEPNLGTAVITATVGGVIFFGAGLRWWMLLVAGGGAVAALPIAYNHLHDYQRARITTFLHPESDPLGAGYNIIQSKIALGSGGMWGKGFLQGTQSHLNFLPEKQTDFIFTLFSEEFGLVGGLALMALLAVIILGGLAMSLRCRHQFGRLVALGLSMNFFMYVLVNIAMVTGAIPVGGVPLPLVSHGGTAMITVMIGMGILMSVHVHRDAEFGEEREPGLSSD